ncbi:MAG: acetylornithine transaminase [Actinobacteria bacterium]|nr:acetylornithine transaminase [Actinomycetota bacterium]
MHTYGRYPIELVSGRGCRVADADGREYLDMVAGIAVTALGHGHPAVVEALHRAADGLVHTSNLYWTEPMVRLAERLTAAAGMERAFFCNSGAESVEAAIKMARRARPGRTRLVAFDGAFHGRTLGALSLTARPAYQEPFRPLVPGTTILPFGDPAALGAIDGTVAMVLVEPVQGEGGVRPAPPGWLAALREACDAAGALLVFDEVQSGMGRTGTLFAFQAEGVVPDAVTSAKALAGGLPMGALLARGEAAGALQPGDHASTFGGGPLVAAVADAVLQVILSDGFLPRVRQAGEALSGSLAAAVTGHPLAGAVRGRGLMQGVALTGPLAADVTAAAAERGLLVCPAGPGVVRFTPPLIVTDAEIDEAAGLFRSALAAVG